MFLGIAIIAEFHVTRLADQFELTEQSTVLHVLPTAHATITVRMAIIQSSGELTTTLHTERRTTTQFATTALLTGTVT